MQRPLVSVIIPTFNRLPLLKMAVNSVLQQSMQDFEIVISDNCSSDGTEIWAKKITVKNNSIFYFRNETNLGMVGNWNAGLTRIKGKYVVILNDDDIWKKDFLQKTLSILEANPNIGLIHTRLSIFIQDKNKPKILKDHWIYKSSKEVDGLTCIRDFLENQWSVSQPSASVFRADCVKKIGLMDTIGADTEYWTRICTIYDFYYLNQSLCLMREHHQRATNKNTDMLEYFSLMLYFTQCIKNYNLAGYKKELLKKSVTKSYARYRQYIINELITHKRKYFFSISGVRLIKLYSQCTSLLNLIPDIVLLEVNHSQKMGKSV